MLRRFWLFITDTRKLALLGLCIMVAVFFVGAELLEIALLWTLAAVAALLGVAALAWMGRRWLATRRARLIEAEITAPDKEANRHEMAVVRDGLQKAITTIKSSRLGIVAGKRALYELPWLVIIGNPAAGKSSAITRSGLQFPFADSKVVQGIGGTRNCDWFFTSEGILLDTAGRYAVEDEHRAEWHGFLDLLKKHRSRAPVNGIVIAVSIAELRSEDADAAMRLARSLRKRVQDLIERLQVFAPVYVMFTKADLIAGFTDFFAPFEQNERERIWGATKPYLRKAGSKDVLVFFDEAFDGLLEGLKETGIANLMQPHRATAAPPSGVFTFPLEFAALRVPLRAFLAVLFEDNPYQFKPVFRGFYFTSALQEGEAPCVQSRRVADRFTLELAADGPAAQTQRSYFLLDLFRKVMFEDRHLVSQYSSRHSVRLQYAGLLCGVLVLGGLLAGWTWSYLANRELIASVQADVDKAARSQKGRVDLQSRLDALVILQGRLEQLQAYRASRPWPLRFGLYQGDALDRKLRSEYLGGMREVMLQPVAASLEAQLHALAPGSAVAAEDGYNALKTYLMLADPAHAEQGHLNDQLSRHWRRWLEANRGAMPREQMIRSAERLMTFYAAQTGAPDLPRIDSKLALVEGARDKLRLAVNGMPARERVYSEIRARANTRFASMTVARIVDEQDRALLTGSHAVPGAFTREAWEGFVERAIADAASKEQQGADWVLKTASKDDLTLSGSPQQIQNARTEMYKNDYAREWQRFVQGVTVQEMKGFGDAVKAMNRLGDPQLSPLAKVLQAIHAQTAWDNPSLLNAQMQQAQTGVINWIKTRVLRMTPAPINVNIQLDAGKYEKPLGPVGREFSALAKLVGNGQPSLMRSYLEALSRLRGRLNTLRNQGDPGPGARQFMQQTLEGNGSELADALRLVDEQMMAGMSDSQRHAIRPILVRPLMQVFAVIVRPAEAELNKTWLAQVYEPFQRSLAQKFPFDGSARVEASAAEIAQIFGPAGAVARFADTALGPLVVRRGDVVTPRTWGDMGITLQAAALRQFPAWISANGISAQTAGQTVFQILPGAASNALEYTLEIDGQLLRHRNGAAQWTNMTHPGPNGVAGARISAIGMDGRSVDLFNESGEAGLGKMIEAAAKSRKDTGVHELRWSVNGVTVALGLRIISSPPAESEARAQEQGFRNMRLPEAVAGAAP
jgi:type VI secretion system protein ImpL